MEQFKLSLPYPEVQGKINDRTMAMLMQSYGGRVSELTAVMQYTFQHLTLSNKPTYKSIESAFLGISITEMEHAELIGKAIVYFGGKPLSSGAYNFWNGSYVNYSEDVKTFLNNNINGEKTAIKEYEQIIAFTDNESLKKLFSRIIMDEQLHVSIFEDMLLNLNK